MSRVALDPDHLDALAADLRRYRGRVDDLLARARALDAGSDLAGLAGAPEWAGGTAAELQARVRLLRTTDATLLAALARYGLSVRDLAADRLPVSDGLLLTGAVHEVDAGTTGPTSRARRSNESLEDWALRVLGDEVARYSHLPLGPAVATGLDWYLTYGDVLASWAVSTNAGLRLTRYAISPALLRMLETGPLSRAPSVLTARATTLVSGWRTMTAPGTAPSYFVGQLMNRAVAFEHLPTTLLSGIPQRAGTFAGHVLGRPWMDPRIPLGPASTAVPRGASNLVSVARNPLPGMSRTTSLARTAGALRGLGVIGGVASTGFDVANLVAQGNPVDAFEREGAGYVADLAKTGFDASLTAALIAPNPITWGAVGVTGVVWAGAELVDHWDDVTAAADQAVDWADDRLDDAVGAVGDLAGGTVDAVKESKLNPGNWF